MLKIFIRHNWPGKKEVLEELFEQGKIAIHYENSHSINSADYKEPAAKKALDLLHKCRNEGAFVGAMYREYEPTRMLVGKIKCGSKLKAESYDNGKMILKTIKLSSCKPISSMVLLGNQPRQCTICRWHKAEKQLEAAVKGKKLHGNVYNLHHAQLEIICYEYLRAYEGLKTLLLPIGRSLPDIDIYGMSCNGQEVIAQVTFGYNIDIKINALKKYPSYKFKIRYFFGPAKQKDDYDGIKYIPIEEAYKKLKRTPIHRKMLKKMMS